MLFLLIIHPYLHFLLNLVTSKPELFLQTSLSFISWSDYTFQSIHNNIFHIFPSLILHPTLFLPAFWVSVGFLSPFIFHPYHHCRSLQASPLLAYFCFVFLLKSINYYTDLSLIKEYFENFFKISKLKSFFPFVVVKKFPQRSTLKRYRLLWGLKLICSFNLPSFPVALLHTLQSNTRRQKFSQDI